MKYSDTEQNEAKTGYKEVYGEMLKCNIKNFTTKTYLR